MLEPGLARAIRIPKEGFKKDFSVVILLVSEASEKRIAKNPSEVFEETPSPSTRLGEVGNGNTPS